MSSQRMTRPARPSPVAELKVVATLGVNGYAGSVGCRVRYFRRCRTFDEHRSDLDAARSDGAALVPQTIPFGQGRARPR